MSLWAWLNLKPMDIVAFIAADVLGFLAALAMPPGPIAIYTLILVSYHLFLVWLLMTADNEAYLSFGIFQTCVYHFAFGSAAILLGIGRHYIPLYGFFRYTIAGLALFERGWLFSGGPRKLKVPIPTVTTQRFESTPADEEAWMRHLAERRSHPIRRQVPLEQEYKQFIAARVRARAAAAETPSSK